ncbi:MAG: hypothetical protein K2K36_07315 [Muribaculaceae bacterium]|nr:hypothetical protein [Muribaculaceae bacterium]
MILFVFEGDRECPLFETIQELFFPKEAEPFVCVYRSNIYSLYSHIKSYDRVGGEEEVDTVSVLKEILCRRGDRGLDGVAPSQVSEVYLFFDYDFHHKRGTLAENNAHLQELLEYFNEETAHGKLYVNYPMVESIYYTGLLPDSGYRDYTVRRDECSGFKGMASRFSAYPSFDHLLLSGNKGEAEEKKRARWLTARANWIHLMDMNVCKANLLCNGSHTYPMKKLDIGQTRIFEAQMRKYVLTDECRVSVLNSFPLFMYEYFSEPPSLVER